MTGQDALSLVVRQQEIVRAVLRGDEVTPEQLAALAAPLPRRPLGEPLDGDVLRALQASSSALGQELDLSLSRVRASLTQSGQARSARYLDTAV